MYIICMKVKPFKKIYPRAKYSFKRSICKVFLPTLCLLCMYYVWCDGESKFLFYEPLICISYFNQNMDNSLHKLNVKSNFKALMLWVMLVRANLSVCAYVGRLVCTCVYFTYLHNISVLYVIKVIILNL